MPVSLGATPQVGFDQPLQLLQDCHRRIENFLEVLLRVVAAAPNHTLPAEHRTALETALRYFRDAAPRHTQDEEESLFPRLRNQRGAQVQEALACLDALESDHVRATELHDRVNTRGAQWLRAGHLPVPERAELQSWLAALRTLYRRHIAIEDRQIFPLAGQLLAAKILTTVGQEIRARRARPVGHACSSPLTKSSTDQTNRHQHLAFFFRRDGVPLSGS